MFGIRLNKELNRKMRWLRILLSTMLFIGSAYSGYVIWLKEKIIDTALQTPEGKETLAKALIEAAKKKP